VGSCVDSGVGSLVGSMLGLAVGTWLGLSLGAWLGLSLDGIMLGLSLGLLLGWMEGTMLQPSLGLLVGMLFGTALILPGLTSLGLLLVGLILGAELLLGLRLPSSKAAAAISDDGQTAQYGPTRTDLGSLLLAQAVSLKVDPKSALSGNLVRESPIPQSQRFCLNKDAL
jgi:hypothetical protein